VPVEPEDAVEQFGAEAVHHRHDDDQRGNAQRDADQRNDGDDGHRRLLAAGPEIAPGDHPLEGRERACRAVLAGDRCAVRRARLVGRSVRVHRFRLP